MSWDQVIALLGLIIGASSGAFGLWWGRRQAARQRGLDERREIISMKSLAAAWKITLGAIFLLFVLLVSGIELSAAPVLGILLLIHMAGWTLSYFYYQLKY